MPFAGASADISCTLRRSSTRTKVPTMELASLLVGSAEDQTWVTLYCNDYCKFCRKCQDVYSQCFDRSHLEVFPSQSCVRRRGRTMKWKEPVAALVDQSCWAKKLSMRTIRLQSKQLGCELKVQPSHAAEVDLEYKRRDRILRWRIPQGLLSGSLSFWRLLR